MTFSHLDLSAFNGAESLPSEQIDLGAPYGHQVIYEVSRDHERSSSDHIVIRIFGSEAHDALCAIPTVDLAPVHALDRAPAIICLAVVSAEDVAATEEAMCRESESYALRVIFCRGDVSSLPLSSRASIVELPNEDSAEAPLMMMLAPFLGFSDICVDFYDYMQVFRPGYGVVRSQYLSTYTPFDPTRASIAHAVWLFASGSDLTLDQWESFNSLEAEALPEDIDIKGCNGVTSCAKTKFLTCHMFHAKPREKRKPAEETDKCFLEALSDDYVR